MFYQRLVVPILLPWICSAEPPGPPTVPAPNGFHTVALNGHNFTLPNGFTIELVASAPQVNRPISAAFDEKGRLYVTDSSGSNDKTAEQVKAKPHRIVRLEDTNGDGTFDKSTDFVKNIMLPEGAMWYRGSLYVAAPPHIWKFTDTDGDGTADKEEIWFDGKTVTGCANDLHGPWLGPDGWIYWTKGAFAKQEYTLPSGKKWSTRASHLFRAKPDGTNIEPVMTGGMDNPVGLAFTPAGEPIVCGTFFQHPADGKRDGILHAVYGGVWGKDHDPVYEHPWTSPQLMPVMTHLGPAAPAGMIRYQSDQFGTGYQDNLFCSQFNLRKVSRHVLVPEGSTYRTVDSDFVVSDNYDFHPTDVVEDADGSLLILDTGGWYKLCCPTSQLVKAEVLGAIYRVKKAGAHTIEDPRGLKIDWSVASLDTLDKEAKLRAIAQLLGDARPAVRWQAVDRLAVHDQDRPTLIRDVTFKAESHVLELHAVWSAIRSGDDALRDFKFRGLNSKDETVRLATHHAISLSRLNQSEVDSLRRSNSPMSLRLAAESYGRSIPKVRPVPPGQLAVGGGVLQALSGTFSMLEMEIKMVLEAQSVDPFLEHTLIYALIESGRPRDIQVLYLGNNKAARVRRAGLIALDQMNSRLLESKAVIAELDSKDTSLREAAWWIAGRHPEWGEQLAGRFAQQLKWADPAKDAALEGQLLKFAKNEAVQKTLMDAVVNAPDPGKRLALRTMSKAPLKTLPEPWRAGLLAVAPTMDDPAVIQAALAVLRALPMSAGDFQTFVSSLRSKRIPVDLKLAVLASKPAGTTIDDAELRLLLRHVQRESSAEYRTHASEALVRTGLGGSQLVKLAGAIPSVGPLERPKLLTIFAHMPDNESGLALLTALSEPAVRRTLRLEQVKPIFDKYPAAVKSRAETLYALLADDRKDEHAKLEKLASSLPKGDAKRGQAVFNGAKAACTTCHKIGYVGGSLGPDLTRIGMIRSERDLLEAIVLPSASFVRSYEPFRVDTLDGRTYNGILKKEGPDEVILAIAADQQVRIPRAEIESMKPSELSVMPAGLDQQVTPQELADLVAFLKANTR